MKLCSWSDLVLATLPLRSLGSPVFLLSFNNVNNINPILHLCFLFHFFFFLLYFYLQEYFWLATLLLMLALYSPYWTWTHLNLQRFWCSAFNLFYRKMFYILVQLLFCLFLPFQLLFWLNHCTLFLFTMYKILLYFLIPSYKQNTSNIYFWRGLSKNLKA